MSSSIDSSLNFKLKAHQIEGFNEIMKCQLGEPVTIVHPRNNLQSIEKEECISADAVAVKGVYIQMQLLMSILSKSHFESILSQSRASNSSAEMKATSLTSSFNYF